jgi:hypothetical protein
LKTTISWGNFPAFFTLKVTFPDVIGPDSIFHSLSVTSTAVAAAAVVAVAAALVVEVGEELDGAVEAAVVALVDDEVIAPWGDAVVTAALSLELLLPHALRAMAPTVRAISTLRIVPPLELVVEQD